MQIALLLRLFKHILQVLLNLRNFLEVIRDLEPLHILHDSREFMILIEIEQFLFRILRRCAVGGVAFATKGDVGEVETEERYGGWSGIAKTGTVFVVVPCVVSEFADSFKLLFVLLWKTLRTQKSVRERDDGKILPLRHSPTKSCAASRWWTNQERQE